MRNYLIIAVVGGALAACGGGSSSSGSAAAGTTTVSGIVGGTSSSPTLAGYPLAISGNVSVNGKTATAAAVQPGTLITATASSIPTTVVASGAHAHAAATQSVNTLTVSDVNVSIEIQGTVDQIDTATGTMQVLGQTVTADALTEIVQENPDGTFATITLADIAVGDYVEVSGVSTAGGSVQATRIEDTLTKSGDAGYNEADVHGTVSSLDTTAKTFLLGAETVDYSNATVKGTLANGGRVEVNGTLSGTTIVATEVEVQDQTHGAAGDDSELEGIVQQLDTTAATFELLGFTVDYSAITPVPTLQDGARVEVQGTFDSSNTTLVHATAVHVSNAHSGDGNADGEAKGQVAAVDGTALTVSIGSSTFWSDANTVIVQDDADVAFSQIQVGSWVEVKYDSQRMQNGAPYATMIEIQAAQSGSSDSGTSELNLEGTISAFDMNNMTLTVNDQSVTVDAATTYQIGDQSSDANTFWSLDHTGQKAEITGHLSGQTYVADKIEVKQ
jgi:hypothetical protein